MGHEKRKKQNLNIFAFILVVIAIFAIAAVVIVTGNKPDGKFSKNTFVNNVDCSNLTTKQAAHKLKKVWGSRFFIIEDKKANTEEELKLESFDLKYPDAEKEIAKIVDNPSLRNIFLSFFGRRTDYRIKMCPEITPLFEQRIYSLKVSNNEGRTKTKNAYLDTSSSDLKIVPEKIGSEIDVKKLENKIIKKIAKGEFCLGFKNSDYPVAPKIDRNNKKLKAKQKFYKKYYSFVLEYDFGKDKVKIPPKKLSEMSFVEDGKRVPKRDEIEKYVYQLSLEHNTIFRNRKFKTESGKVITPAPGTYGKAINQKKEADWLEKAIAKGEDTTRKPKYSQGLYKDATEENEIGTSYVEVNTARQKAYLFVKGRKKLATNVVTGNSSRGKGTKKGVFFIAYKTRNMILRGTDYDGSQYRSPVSYWMPFYDGQGFHDAKWRSSFGGNIYRYDGSHGCVNMPRNAAKRLYSFVEKGFPVVIY